MIVGKFTRLALACGASAAAIALASPNLANAQARQEAATYLLRYGQEIADGYQVVSHSKDIMVARRRTGDRSMLVYDVQNGATTVEAPDRAFVMPHVSRTGPEVSYAFDYQSLKARGGNLGPLGFNAFTKPLVAAAPPLGKDAAWSVTAPMRSMGLPAASDTPVTMRLSRTYLTVERKPVVLVEFDIPAFTYATAAGETVTHWAHGMAVTDPGFGEIHALAVQHRAGVRSASGEMRPVSIRTTMHGIDRDGGWRTSFAAAPQVKAAMGRVSAVAGDRVAPVGAATSPSSSLPILTASRLTSVAFGLTENSANGIQMTLNTGEILEGLGFPPPPQPPAPPPPAPPTSLPPGSTPQYTGEGLGGSTAASILQSMGFPPNFLDTSPGQLSQAELDQLSTALSGLGVQLSTQSGQLLTPEQVASLTASLSAASQGRAPTAEELQRQTELTQMLTQIMEGYNDMAMQVIANIGGGGGGGNPEGSLDFLAPVGPETLQQLQATFDQQRASEGLPPMPQLTSEQLAAMTEAMSGMRPDPATMSQEQLVQYIGSQQRELHLMLMSMLQDLSDDRTPSDTDRDQVLQNITDQRRELYGMLTTMIQELGAGGELTTDQLDDLVSQMAREAERTDPRLQPDDVDSLVAGLPDWIEEDSADAEEYRRLLEELQRELEETRQALEEAEDRDEQADADDDSGFGEDADFYANNAFLYDSMVGIVPTDLTPWAAWLATQNVRELERLARTIGYPNLASALADAGNLIRQAQDQGYRNWAMQAPSCGGYVGCGPNYLERWHAKQATVALGDILAASRDIFSSGGFSDIGVAGLNLDYLLRDHSLQDGDIVHITITQFGRTVYEGELSLTNTGNLFSQPLQRGVASLQIYAVNEGFSPPNTAQIRVDNVVRGQGTQTYSLSTGETATLRIETGAAPGGPQ